MYGGWSILEIFILGTALLFSILFSRLFVYEFFYIFSWNKGDGAGIATIIPQDWQKFKIPSLNLGLLRKYLIGFSKVIIISSGKIQGVQSMLGKVVWRIIIGGKGMVLLLGLWNLFSLFISALWHFLVHWFWRNMKTLAPSKFCIGHCLLWHSPLV